MFTGHDLYFAFKGQDEKQWNFKEWMEICKYENYSLNDLTVKMFWEILINDFSLSDKKAFLKFLTGSIKVPVGGLRHVKFKISRSGDIYKLPSVSTCSNILFLPDYKDKQILFTKLEQAIHGSKGFDFI